MCVCVCVCVCVVCVKGNVDHMMPPYIESTTAHIQLSHDAVASFLGPAQHSHAGRASEQG